MADEDIYPYLSDSASYSPCLYFADNVIIAYAMQWGTQKLLHKAHEK